MKTLPFSKIGIIIVIFGVIFLIWTPHPAHAQADRIVFAVIGDYGQAGQPAADVANLVKSWTPDFIVTVGDNNYPDGLAETIDQNIGQYYHEYIYPYKGKYGSGAITRRFFPSLGNHDWGGNGVKPYIDYFGFKQNQTYYEFTQGPVHFFVLDSDRNEPDGTSSTSQQAIWLRKALAASTSTFNVVVFHHAPYSSGRHGSSEYMRWPFKLWGADVVLSGHDHVYERLLVDGLPYFVNGIGGGEIYNFETILPESQARFNQDFGAMRVEATSAYMKFQFFTRTGLLVDEYTIGQGYPTVSAITLAGPSPTNSQELLFQVNFSEAITGVDASDFLLSTTINGTAINSVNGSGNSYTVSVSSGNGDGTVRLDLVDNDSIANSYGNSLGGPGTGNGNFSNGMTYTVDKTAPSVVSILRATASPINAASVDYLVTFSEPVIGVDLSDFALATNMGAQISGVTGSEAMYTVSITTGSGIDSLRLDFIDNDRVVDKSGNTTTQGATGETYLIDKQPPLVQSITRTGQSTASSVEYAIRFSESVTGVDGGDLFLSTMNGARVESLSGAGDLYTVKIILNSGSDVIRLDINDNDSITDIAGNFLGGTGLGNGNQIGESIPIAIDTPIVTSIIRGSTNPTSNSSVDFIVTFSETVNGVDASDFKLSGINDASILGVTPVNPFYIVSVQTGSMDGELKLELLDDDSIRNTQNIPLGGNGIRNGDFINGDRYRIDRTLPRVTSIIRAGNNPSINPAVDFIVTFSEPVNGVDVSDFSVFTTNLDTRVLNIQNADPFYVVTVSTGAGSGSIRLDLIDNRSIMDLSGNPLADNGSGNGSFNIGEVFNLAKIPVNFSAPTINEIARTNLTNSTLPTLTWSTVRGAVAYEVFISRDTNFTQVIQSKTVSTQSFTPLYSLSDGTYFVRVWAFNGQLNPGKFSKIYSFTIDTTPPTPPTIVSPSNNKTTIKKPWLQWKAESGMTQFEVQIDNNPDFSSPEFTATTNKTSIQSKALVGNRNYFWRVRTKDAAGNWSPWSTVSNFSIP